MSDESLLTISVGVAAVALLLQTTVLVRIWLLILKVRKPVQQIIADVSEIAGIARRRAADVDLTVASISKIARARTEQADAVARELLDKGHLQTLAADRVVCEVLQKIERATDETERLIKKPFRQVHALRAGFRAGFGRLFSRGQQRTNARDAYTVPPRAGNREIW
jgi:hypothetical protein